MHLNGTQQQLARILIKRKKKDSIELMKKSYNQLPFKGVYETFDFAEFLKNNEEFEIL